MIRAVDLRKGKTILHDGSLTLVHECRIVAKGNKGSYMQTKLRNLKTGTMSEVRFNVTEKVEIPYVESKDFEYLYRDGESFVMMDLETFDQFPVDADIVGDSASWLVPNLKVACQLYEDQIISFEVPFTVTLEVVEAPPVVKGATATNQMKEVVLETGAKVRVPPFVEEGEKINVDTRTGEYIDRAK